MTQTGGTFPVAVGVRLVRLAVISDIHSAAAPFRAALGAARDAGFDRLILLGDLLTYGVAPQETIDLVQEALSRDAALLIRGNHDQVYLERAGGVSSYERAMPDWIRESVDWTCARLPTPESLRGLAWRDEWSGHGVYAAHANPFGAGDWRYLRSPDEMDAALDALNLRACRIGIFGHTHRFRTHERGASQLLTVGSVGQPRDAARESEWTLIETSAARLRIERRKVDVDWSELVRAVRATSLSEPTKERICGFYQ